MKNDFIRLESKLWISIICHSLQLLKSSICQKWWTCFQLTKRLTSFSVIINCNWKSGKRNMTNRECRTSQVCSAEHVTNSSMLTWASFTINSALRKSRKSKVKTKSIYCSWICQQKQLKRWWSSTGTKTTNNRGSLWEHQPCRGGIIMWATRVSQVCNK